MRGIVHLNLHDKSLSSQKCEYQLSPNMQKKRMPAHPYLRTTHEQFPITQKRSCLNSSFLIDAMKLALGNHLTATFGYNVEDNGCQKNETFYDLLPVLVNAHQ